MKNIFKLMALLLCFVGLTACGDDEPAAVPMLEVTYANLHGTWQLTEREGQPLPEGIYCYITFNRKEKSFEMYQNFDSMYARCITGRFKIEKDAYLGYIISGKYDYQQGDWSDSYIVTDLLSSGSMTWTGKNDAQNVQRYQRCDKVPADILEQVGKAN